MGQKEINNSNQNQDALSVEELKQKFGETKQRIINLNASCDKKRGGLTQEDKDAYRTEYTKACSYANLLSKRSNDLELRKQYEEAYKQLVVRARMYGSLVQDKIPSTTLDDVKGLEDIKVLIKNFIFITENSELIKQYNLSGGFGLMMYGPPGTGKTLIAEAIANAMKVPFFMITPADVFKSYVGESEKSVKYIFDELELCENGAVLFVDECESIFSKRNSDTKDYKASVTTELLQRMNGFGKSGNKRVMIAATNRPDMIDPAYLRFKRFSNILFVDLPNKQAKSAIISAKIPPVGLDDSITENDILDMASDESKFFSAADICGILEEACMFAIEEMQTQKTSQPIKLSYTMIKKAFDKFKPKLDKQSYDFYKNFNITNI